MSSAGDAKRTIDELIAQTHSAEFFLNKGQNEVNGITQELLLLSIQGTNSPELRGAIIGAPQVAQDIDAAITALAFVRDELETYRRQL